MHDVLLLLFFWLNFMTLGLLCAHFNATQLHLTATGSWRSPRFSSNVQQKPCSSLRVCVCVLPGDQYALKMRLVDHVYDDQVIDSMTVKIILPEGAK